MILIIQRKKLDFIVMKISIKKFLAVALMSVIASVVCAQAPKIKYDATKLYPRDVARIKALLVKNQNISSEDSLMTEILLRQKNFPQRSVVYEDGDFVSDAQAGDDVISFISYQLGCFWLSYVVERKQIFIGRFDIRLD